MYGGRAFPGDETAALGLLLAPPDVEAETPEALVAGASGLRGGSGHRGAHGRQLVESTKREHHHGREAGVLVRILALPLACRAEHGWIVEIARNET